MVQQSIIAAELNVSQQTVSRVLTKPHLVREETRERVLAAMRRHRYQTNHLANKFRSRRLDMLGICVPSTRHSYFPSIIDGVQQVAGERGNHVVIECTRDRSDVEQSAVKMMRGLQFGGVLVTPTPGNEPFYADLRESNFPFAFIDRYLDGFDSPYIGTNNQAGAKLAVDHLVALGHRRIGLVTATIDHPDISSIRDRREGYLEAMAGHGLEPDDVWLLPGGFTIEAGKAAVARIMALPETRRPTAVFCDNDSAAVGVICALQAAGCRVPQDLSVVGFANFDWTAYTSVPLTTIAQCAIEMGRHAAQVLLEMIQQPEIDGRKLELAPELVVRQSTAPLSESAHN